MTDSLTALLTELRERFSPGADVHEVEIYLASRGYDAHQIGEILAVFAAHLEGVAGPNARPTAPRGAPRPEGPTFRVMGPHERPRFAPEAWGHLLALTASGVITPAEREHLIERAITHSDGRIGLAELRAFLEGAGVDESGSAGATTIH
jgi:uncharacterized protein Smg (DUF494 family)